MRDRPRGVNGSWRWLFAGVVLGLAAPARGEPLPGTAPLDLPGPLDEVMVAGIDRFLLARTAAEKTARRAAWDGRLADGAGREAFRDDARARLRTILGVVDERVRDTGVSLLDAPGAGVAIATTDEWTAAMVAFPALDGVHADGIAIVPATVPPRAWVVAVPDCDWTPEAFAGLVAGNGPAGGASRLPRALVAAGCGLFIPGILDRSADFSGNARVRFTNQPHREYAYRPAYELGRHPLGYEIQKILAAVDRIEALATPRTPALPVGVCGVGEGGRLALLAAACDERIDAALVCGSFGPREATWAEPLDRNVWRVLTTASDAEAAALVLPRTLVIEAAVAGSFAGPEPPADGRGGGAAPGRIAPVSPADHADETGKARGYAARLGAEDRLTVTGDPAAPGPAGDPAALRAFLAGLGIDAPGTALAAPAARLDAATTAAANRRRQRRQLEEIARHTQRLLEWSAAARASDWREVIAAAQRNDRAAAEAALATQRERIRTELIGRLPDPSMPLGVRSRRVLDDPAFSGWEVTIDVFPDVIAGGILLVPKGIPAGERRPTVVCQHGLEGVPLDTIAHAGEAHAVYRGFTAELARRGYVTFAPQNPYRGGDRFRTLQRKANPLGLSLFSFIIPQHGRILDFLATLPEVDPHRFGFYGLSYGGKTAMRVPPFEPRYRLSICSADYDEWVRKIAVDHAPYSYVFTGEYEIFEWNMGHLANYAELSWLIWPRPFMVERGHDDGVAPDEWVAWEFAKTRRHWVKLGRADDCAIEWFDGPHAINGVGTYEFLDRHLDPEGTLPRSD